MRVEEFAEHIGMTRQSVLYRISRGVIKADKVELTCGQFRYDIPESELGKFKISNDLCSTWLSRPIRRMV